jgi:hypothetical protein
MAKWLRNRASGAPVRVEANGMRSQVAALVAAALDPKAFSEVVVRGGIQTLASLYEKPVLFSEAPDLFCLDLYKETDLDRLAVLAEPANIQVQPSKQ